MLINMKNNHQEISRMCDEIKNFCAANNVSDAKYHDIVLIVDEIVANIINYAYPDQMEHEFSLNIIKENDRVCIKIVDGGIPFDPLNHKDPDTSAEIEERQIGGLGIFLVKQLSEYVEYSRIDDRNQLDIVVELFSNKGEE